MTLDQAQDRFRAEPNTLNAGVYLEALSEYESDDMIGDDTFRNGIAEVTYWLLYNKQMANP